MFSANSDNIRRGHGGRPIVWLVKDGEALPIDKDPRLHRTGALAGSLIESGFAVVWWAGRFDHHRKEHRDQVSPLAIRDNYQLCLVDGPGYTANLSLARLRHHRACATDFLRAAWAMPRPNVIVASYPTVELCLAAMNLCRRYGIPLIIDLRDPWPDNLPGFLSPASRWLLTPALLYYHRCLRRLAHHAAGLTAISNTLLQWAHRLCGERDDRCDTVFPIGCEAPERPREVTLPSDFSEDRPLICLSLASGGRSFDGDTLIEAARVLKSREERRVRFVVAGEGEIIPRLTDAARGLGNIRFVGWLQHAAVQQHLMNSHVGLVLVQGDVARFWLGNRFFEYLSASLALISNVQGEASDLIRTFQLGVTVRPKDPIGLADVVTKFANAPQMVGRFMRNSWSTFLAHFERRKVYDAYVDYIRKTFTASVPGHNASAGTGSNTAGGLGL